MLDIAWKAQLRLCARFRRLSARGINRNKIVVAIARELAGFVWAIGQRVKGRISAFVQHFSDVDVTESQRSSNTHSSPWEGLSEGYGMVVNKGCSAGARRRRAKQRMP